MSFIVVSYDKSRSDPVDLATLNRMLADGEVKPTQMVIDQLTGETTNATAISGAIIPKRGIYVGEAPPQFVEYPRPLLTNPRRPSKKIAIPVAVTWLVLGNFMFWINGYPTNLVTHAPALVLLGASALFAQFSFKSNSRMVRFIQVASIASICIWLILWFVRPR